MLPQMNVIYMHIKFDVIKWDIRVQEKLFPTF